MTVRGVLRDGAIAFLAGTVISARVGAPERAVATTARRDDDGRAGTANELAREVVVWCDVLAWWCETEPLDAESALAARSSSVGSPELAAKRLSMAAAPAPNEPYMATRWKK